MLLDSYEERPAVINTKVNAIARYMNVPLTTITACCGSGHMTYPTEFTSETIAVRKDQVGRIAEGLEPYAVQTEGRSMEGYGIAEGSIVVINPAEEVRTGNVAMIIIDEKASIKKLYERSDGVDLVSASGELYHVTKEELAEGYYVRICGRVMLVISPPSLPNEGV